MKKFLVMIMSLVMATILSSTALAASGDVPNTGGSSGGSFGGGSAGSSIIPVANCTLSIPEVSYFDGAMNFSVDVQNNSLETTGTAYFALFNGDTLLGVSSKPATTIPAGSSTITGTVDMTEPSEGTSYIVKVFLWSEDMVSLSPMQLVNYTYYKETVLELPTELYCANSYNGTQLCFYKNITTLRYNTYSLSNTCKLYVNDVESDIDLLNSYIRTPKTNVILRDKNNDKYYDEIRLRVYATAWVDYVVVNGDLVRIMFSDQALTDNNAKLTIDTSDSSVSCSVKDTEGNYIPLTDIESTNVLSIEYDVNTGFLDSSFYNITVSTDTITGKVTALSQNSFGVDEYTINGNAYYIVEGMNPYIKVGGEYVLYLSPYGGIAGAKRLSSSYNYGIIERVYKSAVGEPTVRIIDKTGVKRTYEYAGDATQATPSEDPTGVINKIYNASANNLITVTLEERIVDYVITSSNEIKIKSDIQNIVKSTEVDKEYRASTGRLGSTFIDDTTIMLDISDWACDFSQPVYSISKSSLYDGLCYSAVAAKEYSTITNTPASFMAIYEGLGGWSVHSPMAVVTKTLITSVDGQTRIQLNVIENGEEKTLICEDDNPKYNLAEGTAFMYLTDGEGFVNEIVPILTVDLASSDKYDFYTAILSNEADNELSAKEMANTGIINSDLYPYGSVGSRLQKGADYVEFIFAPVLNRASRGITIGGVTYGKVYNLKSYLTGKVNADAYYTYEAGECYDYDLDVPVTVYTFSNRNGYKVELGDSSSIVKSIIPKPSDKTASYLNTYGTLINLGAEAIGTGVDADPNIISFVLLKVFDDKVQSAYALVFDDYCDSMFKAPTSSIAW